MPLLVKNLKPLGPCLRRDDELGYSRLSQVNTVPAFRNGRQGLIDALAPDCALEQSWWQDSPELAREVYCALRAIVSGAHGTPLTSRPLS